MKSIVKLSLLMLFFACSSMLYAQEQKVRGKVVDSEDQPIAGVVVYYDGANLSTITNTDGKYEIAAKKGKTLVFNYFGMKDVKVLMTGQSICDVIMEPDEMVIEDAVVIGYGSVSRRDLTGSVTSVKAEELKKAGNSNVFGSLQGKVAGLSITSQSGEPGSGFSIKIRGNNSINAGTTPLFVIDGMQMDISSSEVASSSATGSGSYDPMSFLNPSDIESIEVLKDASATAIYGARGANGVVIITTKGGAKGYDKTNVTFDAQFGMAETTKYIEMLGPQDYIDYRFHRGDYGYYSFGADTDGDMEVDSPMSAEGYEFYDW